MTAQRSYPLLTNSINMANDAIQAIKTNGGLVMLHNPYKFLHANKFFSFSFNIESEEMTFSSMVTS